MQSLKMISQLKKPRQSHKNNGTFNRKTVIVLMFCMKVHGTGFHLKRQHYDGCKSPCTEHWYKIRCKLKCEKLCGEILWAFWAFFLGLNKCSFHWKYTVILNTEFNGICRYNKLLFMEFSRRYIITELRL